MLPLARLTATNYNTAAHADFHTITVFAALTAFSSGNQRPACSAENIVIIEFTNWFCITRNFNMNIPVIYKGKKSKVMVK